MHRNLSVLIVLAGLCAWSGADRPALADGRPDDAAAQQPRESRRPGGAERSEDPIAQHFFTPELLQRFHEIIALTDEQENAIRTAVEGIQEKMQTLHGEIESARGELADAIKGEKIDPEKTLTLADNVMKLESQAKHLQLEMLIKIKNSLTSEQQAKLLDVREKMGGVEKRFREAMSMAEKIKNNGGDVSEFQQSREELEGLLRSGKLPEAEALLDKTVKQLKEKAGASEK